MYKEPNPVVAALAELSDAELRALIAATYGVPQTAPGLLAWLDSACDWEFYRRRGFDYPLLPHEAAIDPSEDAVSIDATMAMRATFAQETRAEASAATDKARAMMEMPRDQNCLRCWCRCSTRFRRVA